MTVLLSDGNRNYIICNNCHNITSIFWDPNKYCSVCGSKNIINHKEGNFYLYERILKKSMGPNYIQTNDQSIVSICPNCNFENKKYDLICPLCGFYLQNKCSGISLSEYNHITKEIHNIDNEFEWLNEFNDGNLKPGSLIVDNIDGNSSNKFHKHNNDRFLPGYANFCFECGRMSTFALQNSSKYWEDISEISNHF